MIIVYALELREPPASPPPSCVAACTTTAEGKKTQVCAWYRGQFVGLGCPVGVKLSDFVPLRH
ncbi:hypothetical protein I79_007250 [Cricetulus griseus]|uniref:Uncharacterized protein n=1 Tax=Cricetulus griseus TaxID=10029 RepID=G3HA12_CRIGR|nr:hypothetical protein I79_007250 [Cricetulus griseus]